MKHETAKMNGRPLRVAVVGAGPRSVCYARYAMQRPEAMRVVAVADPNPRRRAVFGDSHGIPVENRFESHEQLARRPDLADAVFNTTPDPMHYGSSLALLKAGYHILLEKPIAPTEREVRDLIQAAARHDRIVMVCHTMRYEPLFQTIKAHLDAGDIGSLISLHTIEDVSYDHLATTFLRHPRNLNPNLPPMLLSKCCHDLDILAWLAGNKPLRRVASMKSRGQFDPERAPQGSAERCLDGCDVEPTCRYSARALYIEDDSWDMYAWAANEYPTRPSVARKLEILDADSPYGRCVWRCPNNVVDHQGVLVQFADGTTASHDLYCATPQPGRTIRVVGTEGEITGDHMTGSVRLRRPVRGSPGRFSEQHRQLPVHDRKLPGPRPCEAALVADFIATVRGDADARGITRIEDSLVGHQIAFAAEVASREGRVVEIDRGSHPSAGSDGSKGKRPSIGAFASS